MLSLQEIGVDITKSALQQRVSRAMSESKHSDVLEEMNTIISQATDSTTSMSITCNGTDYDVGRDSLTIPLKSSNIKAVLLLKRGKTKSMKVSVSM